MFKLHSLEDNHIGITYQWGHEESVAGSPSEMTQVFMELLQNSTEAMPEGGRIEITSSYRRSGIEVVFTDTGPGIPEAAFDEVFSPFNTTKREGRALGLGLTLVQSIMIGHRGTCRVRASHKGAAIELWFPVSS